MTKKDRRKQCAEEIYKVAEDMHRQFLDIAMAKVNPLFIDGNVEKLKDLPVTELGKKLAEFRKMSAENRIKLTDRYKEELKHYRDALMGLVEEELLSALADPVAVESFEEFKTLLAEEEKSNVFWIAKDLNGIFKEKMKCVKYLIPDLQKEEKHND